VLPVHSHAQKGSTKHSAATNTESPIVFSADFFPRHQRPITLLQSFLFEFTWVFRASSRLTPCLPFPSRSWAPSAAYFRTAPQSDR
jgi:hypothetical protein